MWSKDKPRFRGCDPAGAPPGWCLRWVAYAQGEPRMVINRPKHAHTSFVYIVGGFGTVTIAGNEHRLGPGDAFVLPQGMDHRLAYDDLDPWKMLFLGCRGPLPTQLRVAYGIEDTLVFRRAPIAQPIRNLLNFSGSDGDLQLSTGHTIHELVSKLHACVKIAPDWPDIVIRAKAFIDSNLESAIRLSDIASHAGCSEAHLSRSFRRCVGHPPIDYLIARRMDLAKALLDTTSEPVKAIAERLGYRDTFAFSHAFKSVIGTSPSLWRAAQNLAR
jgi:AraC-like DNA-binding protein